MRGFDKMDQELLGCDEAGLDASGDYVLSDNSKEDIDIVRSAVFELTDEITGNKIKVTVANTAYGLSVSPEGYGGGEYPLLLDYFSSQLPEQNKGPLRVFVWADPEEDNPSHEISLDLVKDEQEGA